VTYADHVSDNQPSLPVKVGDTIFAAVTMTVGQAMAGAAMAARLATKGEELLDETLETMRVARPFMSAVNDLIEDGLMQDLHSLLKKVDRSLDVAINALELTTPTLKTLQQTQEDIRVARQTAEQMLGMVTESIQAVESIPGASLVTGTVRGTIKTARKTASDTAKTASRLAKPRELPTTD